MSVRDLLGGEQLDPSDRFVTGSLAPSFENVKVVRYQGAGDGGRYRADERFGRLPTEVLERTVMYRNTLHEGGRGSAKAITRADLLRHCGL